MKRIFLYCIVFSALIACNSNKTNSSSTEEKAEEIETPITPEVNEEPGIDVVLESIYATNTAIPIKEFNVINVIDNDESTIWKTPFGAGTDEGIMFYFKNETEIGTIKLIMNQSGDFVGVKNYTVYGDGKILRNESNTNVLFKTDSKVSSLYIRFGERLDKKEIKRDALNNEEFSSISTQEFYPEDRCIGISEIKFYDKEGTPIHLIPPKVVNCEITSSSTLAPEQAYSPMNLSDNKKEFAWAEGAKGNGVSEWVKFKFEKDVTITELKIWNGYQRSETHFIDNARAKEISVIDSNGKSLNFTLSDDMTPQECILKEAFSGKEITVKVESVYPGKKYSDLVLSEIMFYDAEGTVLPFNLFEEEKITASNAIENKQLKAIIDRLIKTKHVEEDYDNEEKISHSLIIRSNNSFVYYGDSFSGDYYSSENLKTIIAEGGWEFIKGSDNSARIRIFGKMYESTYANIAYKGKTEEVATNIFQDFLTITDSSIAGDTFIEKIDLLW